MSQHDERVRREFTRQADTMAGAALFNDAAVLERIREAVHFTASPRILDVACGPGIVVEKLAPGAAEVVGCDLTPQMLEKTRQRCAGAGLANVRAVPGRAEALPFDDGHFDVVVSRSAVHHFAEPPAALREMARVVRRGGRVITVDVTAAEDATAAALHNAPERVGPLRVVMAALARAGQDAGIGLRLEGTALRFEHHAALTVAVKP